MVGTTRKGFASTRMWVALAALFVAAVFLYELLNQSVMIGFVNPTLWVVTNLIAFAGALALIFYVVVYGLGFNWSRLPDGSANVGGRLIFALTTSLAGVVLLAVLQIFFVPTTGRPWYIAPDEPVFWLPSLRFVVYTSITTSILAMDATLVRRFVRAQSLEITAPLRESSR